MTVTKVSWTQSSLATPAPGEAELVLTVAHVDHAADDVIVLTLCAADGSTLPDWNPGAHIDVVVDASTVRQYSLCGDPADRAHWQIAVRRMPEGRGGSIRLHDNVSQGSMLMIRGPRNGFPLVDGPRQYVFLAGGIGITPLLPMIAALALQDTTWRLHYGGRTRASMPFITALSQHGDRVRICPEDESGLLDLSAVFATPESGTAVYCCGPEALIAAAEARCADRGDISLHVERFAPRPDGAMRPDETFEVYCAASDLTLIVPPGTSILKAAEEAGIDVLSSCMEGTCGTCEVDVLDGVPDHRDSFLSPPERESNETMLICVSRCAGKKLTIDL